MAESFDILGVKIALTNLSKTCQAFEYWIKENKKTYVCIAPVSTIVDAQEDLAYREIINNAGMTTPDGMPLVWLGKMTGNRQIERTYGPDLMRAFCAFSEKKGFKHYFYGGTDATIKLLLENLKKNFPDLKIAGYFIPPFRKTGEIENRTVLDQINKVNPDVLWIGLGSPKQDYWMHNHRVLLNAPVMVGVGAAFDFIAGTKPQAPLWIRKVGLEWLFRLCCEPRRLWKRYLIGNTRFLLLLLKDWVTRPFVRKEND